LKLRFWLPYEDLPNPTRKRVDVNIDISSLTRRVMKKAQLQCLRIGLVETAQHRNLCVVLGIDWHFKLTLALSS
jgi:hypothetical protein